MNPKLKAMHDELQSLIKEANEIGANEDFTPEQTARAQELLADIEAQKAKIETAKNLDAAAGDANKYLNGSSEISSISATTPAESPDDKLKRLADMKAHGVRAANFMSIEPDRHKAAEKAHRLGQFIFALSGNERARKWCQMHGLEFQAAHEEGVNEKGGFLVPIELDTDMIVLREQFGVFRQHARHTPMGSDATQRMRRTSGLSYAWVSEGGTLSESEKGWDRVGLTAKKLGILAKYTSEIDEDALVDVGDDLAGEIAYSFSLAEDQAGFNGDGTSAYGKIVGVRQRLLDVFTTSGGLGLILGAGNAYSELTLANFEDVDGALPMYAEKNAKWFMHKKFWTSTARRLALASGGVPAAEIIAGTRRQFLGYDVVLSQVMPSVTANSQVPCVFGDLSKAAMFGDRRATTIAVSAHSSFSSDVIDVRGTERVDINVHDVGTASVEAGPIVGLIMAAS